MKAAPLPPNEPERLKSLQEHRLLDTLPEEVYDEITKIATEICGTPIALLTLLDEERQWFKSKQGTGLQETPREYSFCAHAILNPDEAFIIPDVRYDERFHDNPLTTGESRFVFYAGVPVKDAEGRALGSLCVIDSRPRDIDEQKMASLKALAKLISINFELRRSKQELEGSKQELQSAQPAVDAIREEVQALVKSNEFNQKERLTALEQAADALKRIYE